MLNIAKIRKEWFIEKIETLKKDGTPYSEIAARLGIKPQYLNLIKNTGRGASEKLTLKLCTTFNINHNELLERIRTDEKKLPETPKGKDSDVPFFSQKKIPLYDHHTSDMNRNRTGEANGQASHGEVREWIDTGDLFPGATSAVRHYGDSMAEYPSGSILVLKQLIDLTLIIWGRNYYVETQEISVIKRLQNGGKNHVIGYSSSEQTYPDGRLIHEPVKIPKESICHISLILGCVIKEFSGRAIPVAANTV
ncbi:MAG: hypothetical protein PHH64_07605 [Proteiniphilum sp.]|nr:hypothetical protein [Proteiniphilum sp.]MDD4159257.1 hypothetical protein [Proteiniphilum sp.]MDD4799631.1 hypothetical protein [Proteiniphilum sp.]